MLLLTLSHPVVCKKQLHSEQKHCCTGSTWLGAEGGLDSEIHLGSAAYLSLQSMAQKDVVAMPQWRCCGLSWEWCRFQF